MMKKPLWYFEEEPKIAALADYAQRKQCLKTAWAGLKTLPRYQVNIVYPAPWMVAPEQRDAWMDYYLECMGLYQEYPKRVVLWPLDVWLLEQGDLATELPTSNSLKAFLLGNERQDLFELLEALESVASMRAKGVAEERSRFVMAEESQLTEEQVQEVLDLIERVGAIDTLQAENTELKRSVEVLERTVDDLKQHQTAQSMSDDAQVDRLKSQIRSLEERLETADAKIDDKKLKELEAKNKELTEENKLVLDQLFKVQEELERYFLENKAIKNEASLSAGLMQQMTVKLLSGVLPAQVTLEGRLS